MKLRNKKTGEIIKDAQYRNYSTRDGFVITTPTDKYSYKSLKEFCEDWEDAEDINAPSMPLIKDEKIRKAVRAWWETIPDAVTDKRVIYKNNNDFEVGVYSIYCGAIYPETLEKCRMYTIEELCGDEEAPEPIEPMFIDLDGRIKEKGEE